MDLDDDALLVHADALIEKGDPRGEFITTSMALERAGIREPLDLIRANVDDAELVRLVQLYRRQQELERAHADAWSRELVGPKDDHYRVQYTRGLPALLKLEESNATRLKQLAKRDLSGVRELRLGYRNDHRQVIPFLAGLPRLRKLTLFHKSAREDLVDVGELPAFTSLVELTLFGATDRAGLDRLAAHPLAARLEVLELTYCDTLGDDALVALDGRFPRLRSLNLHGVGLTPKGMAANRTLVIPGDFSLHGNPIKDRGAAALADWPLDAVTKLGVGRCGLRDVGMKALMASKHLGSLEELETSYNAHTDVSAAAIARAKTPRLAILDLHENSVTAKGLAKIVKAHALRELRFDPKRGDGDASILALARSPHASALRDVSMFECKVGDKGAHALASTPALAELRGLRLFGCTMSDTGARAILASPHLRRLVYLALTGKRIRKVEAPTLPTMLDIDVG